MRGWNSVSSFPRSAGIFILKLTRVWDPQIMSLRNPLVNSARGHCSTSHVLPGSHLLSHLPPRHLQPGAPARSQRDTHPKLRDENVRDAAQDCHEVEDVPGVTEVILKTQNGSRLFVGGLHTVALRIHSRRGSGGPCAVPGIELSMTTLGHPTQLHHIMRGPSQRCSKDPSVSQSNSELEQA